MAVLMFCLRRRSDLTWQEFSDYWRDVHAPLVAQHADVLGVRRYVHMRTLDLPGLQRALQQRNGGSPDHHDGVAQIWMDEPDAIGRPTTEEARVAAAALLEDERNFIDLLNSPLRVVKRDDAGARRGSDGRPVPGGPDSGSGTTVVPTTRPPQRPRRRTIADGRSRTSVRCRAAALLALIDLIDLIGLDVTVAALESLAAVDGDPCLRPAVTLRDRAAAGCLGRESGAGSHAYA